MIDSFHFLRPWLLLALIPVSLILFFEFMRGAQRSSWQKVIDPQLLQFQLGAQQDTTKKWQHLLTLSACALVILAMAGPVWDQRPLPVFRDQLARVIVLDVSRSMDANDVEPSRITRARYKVRDILEKSHNIQVGLIAFGAAAYVISPLTDDVRTITAMVPSLSTGIVPVQGSDLSAALRESMNLMRGAGVEVGEVVLLSDEAPGAVDLEVARELSANGYVLSVLAVGTEEGAPIPDRGSFLKDSAGNIVVPGLNLASLRQLAETGGGRFAQLSADDSDIGMLVSDESRLKAAKKRVAENKQTDTWIERGPWLLLPLLPYVAFLFRKGRV